MPSFAIFPFVSANGQMEAGADIVAALEFGLDAALTPLQASDPALATAIRRNLGGLTATFAGHAERRGGVIRFDLTEPLKITGAKGAMVNVPMLSLSGKQSGSERGAGGKSLRPRPAQCQAGPAQSDVERRRLYQRCRAFRPLQFRRAARRRHFGAGDIVLAERAVCLQALRLRARRLGRIPSRRQRYGQEYKGDICAPPNQPLLTGEGIAWTLTGQARNASADLPLATVHAENVVASLNFDGEGAPLKGTRHHHRQPDGGPRCDPAL
jgi:hypothetical protein